jgi:phosphatidylglycerol:prolipoprotein diacylglycerol transferase
MLPYFSVVSFKLGPLTIFVWGFCVSLGFLAGILTAYFVCKKPPHSPPISPQAKQGELEGVDFNKIFNLSILLLIFGLLGARFFWWLEHLNEVNSFLDFINIRGGGLSSLGGFIFAGVVLVIIWGLTKPYKLVGLRKPFSFLKYLDILAIGFVPLWIFSRLGCFLIHDHPGQLSNFFLAINFPDGARFDMAFLEIILMILIGVSFLVWKPKKCGGYAVRIILIYSFVRFFLDFLRATDIPGSDPRYFGLTLAQYGMAVLFIAAALTIWRKCVMMKYSEKVFKINE